MENIIEKANQIVESAEELADIVSQRVELEQLMVEAIIDIENNAYHVREHGWGCGVLDGISASFKAQYGSSKGELAYNLMYEQCQFIAWRKNG